MPMLPTPAWTQQVDRGREDGGSGGATSGHERGTTVATATDSLGCPEGPPVRSPADDAIELDAAQCAVKRFRWFKDHNMV